MNPGVSLQLTGDLPMFFVTWCSASNVSSDVEGVLMISTNFIAAQRQDVQDHGDCRCRMVRDLPGTALDRSALDPCGELDPDSPS